MIIKNAVYFEQIFHWELLEVIEENDLLLKTFRNKILKDFNKLDNAAIGYFEYEDYTYDEGSFTSWNPVKYNYYLTELLGVIDIDKDKEIADFLSIVIFNGKFDGTEEISEKISFSKVATVLLNLGLIDSEDAIRHYTAGFLKDIKELVFLEYMTRECTKESLKIIKNNKQLVREADDLFLAEIKALKSIDFIDLIDFFDDYTQIKNILPLKKTTKKLKELDIDSLYEKAAENLKKNHSSEKKVDKETLKERQYYFDIDDNHIDEIMKTIKNNLL